MIKATKKAIAILLAAILIFSLGTGCSKKNNDNSNETGTSLVTLKKNDKNGAKVPNILGTDIDSAKQVLTALGLIPIVIEEYSEYSEGKVFSTIPKADTVIEKGSPVTVKLSKGYDYIGCDSFTGRLSCTDDYRYGSWNTGNAEINGGVLRLTLYIIDFEELIKATGELKSKSEFLNNSVTASTDKDMNQSVPVNFKYEKRETSRVSEFSGFNTLKSKVDITVEIPLEQLNTKMPSNIYLRVPFTYANEDHSFLFSLSFLWRINEDGPVTEKVTDKIQIDDEGNSFCIDSEGNYYDMNPIPEDFQ